MANSFGNDKSFMMADYAPGGAMRWDVSNESGEDEYDRFVAAQRQQGCTCRWQLRNGTDVERKENPEWDRCPIHGL